MRLSLLFIITLITKLVLADSDTECWEKLTALQLFVVSDDQEVNNLGLSSIHEGAGINYFQLGVYAETLNFDESLGLLYKTTNTGDGYEYNLTVSVIQNNQWYKGFPYLQLSVTQPNIKWGFDKSNEAYYLKAIDGSRGTFAAAKITGDPYSVSEGAFLVGFGDPFIFESSVTDLKKIKIKAVKV